MPYRRLVERVAALEELRDRGEFGFERVLIGKARDKTAEIRLSDTRGRTRIRISVDPSGTPRIEFLDQAGKVVHAVPDDRNDAQAK